MLELPVAAPFRDKNPAVFREQTQHHPDFDNGNCCLLRLVGPSCGLVVNEWFPALAFLDFPYAITYISPMKSLSSTELRANLSAVMDRVNDDHEPVIIHRARGKPVVMVSLEDWASMDETAYLLSSPANRASLLQGIAELDAGHGIVKTMEELEAMAEE